MRKLFVCNAKIELPVEVFVSAASAEDALTLADQAIGTTHLAASLSLRLEREFTIPVQEGSKSCFATVDVASEIAVFEVFSASELEDKKTMEVAHA